MSHRIFYFHVPVAWVALYGPIFSLLAAIVYLITRNEKWDLYSFVFNKISILFAAGVLFSGPIWAYSAWGEAWDRTDARLQSFLILVLSLLVYFLVRSLIVDETKKYLYSAFLTILVSFNSVLTWGAIRWMENPGNHPGSVLGKGGMDPDMKTAFWAGVLAYHIFFLLLFRLGLKNEFLWREINLVKSESGS